MGGQTSDCPVIMRKEAGADKLVEFWIIFYDKDVDHAFAFC
jgi:hypothetical protein